MTTLLLPPDEVARVRTLKGQVAYILAIMIILDRYHAGCAFRSDQVALVAGLDERTVSKQLKDLSAMGRVILSASGYVLTEGGRAMFLPAGDVQALALSPASVTTTEQVLSPDPDNRQALEAQALNIVDVIATEPIMQDKTPAHNLCALEEVSNLILISKDPTYFTYYDAKIAQSLDPKRVFGKSYLLFGESVTKRDAALSQVLAIFAHVYQLREKFNYPARVAYAMLRDNKDPREEILDNPWKFLPGNYLESLGVARYECRLCDCEKFSTVKEMEAHLQAAHPPKHICEECGQEFPDSDTNSRHYLSEHTAVQVLPDPEDDSVIVDQKAVKAWGSVLEQMKLQMHAAPFKTWVKDTKAIRFGVDGNLIVSVNNEATKDWLDERIRKIAERLLVGIAGKEISVSFIVKEGLS